MICEEYIKYSIHTTKSDKEETKPGKTVGWHHHTNTDTPDRPSRKSNTNNTVAGHRSKGHKGS